VSALVQETDAWGDPVIDARYARIVVPASPSWSVDGEDDYMAVGKDGETFWRNHRWEVAESVSVSQVESNRGNAVTRFPVVIDAYGDYVGMDSAAALALAAALIEAVRRRDQIAAAEK
jgi:hypothetical protein